MTMSREAIGIPRKNLMYNQSVNNEDSQEKMKTIRALSELMDSRFMGPFGIRFGLDGVLGLIPIVGDIVTTFISLYLMLTAARLGATPVTLIRMALNVLIENMMNVFPFVGDAFDFWWKSNLRNTAIMEAQLLKPEKVSASSRAIVMGLILLFFAVIFLMVYLSLMIFQFFIGLLSSL